MRDPLQAARWVDANLDVADLCVNLKEKFGPAFPPSRLLALTPFELLTLFTREDGATNEIDRVAELHRVNHQVRAPALPPVVPSWVMPKVKRAKRNHR